MDKLLVNMKVGKVEDILDILPHGSGIDNDWSAEFISEETDWWKFYNAYHAMDENGFYAGWLYFSITVNTKVPANKWKFEFEFDITSNDLDDCIDVESLESYLIDWLYYGFDNVVSINKQIIDGIEYEFREDYTR